MLLKCCGSAGLPGGQFVKSGTATDALEVVSVQQLLALTVAGLYNKAVPKQPARAEVRRRNTLFLPPGKYRFIPTRSLLSKRLPSKKPL